MLGDIGSQDGVRRRRVEVTSLWISNCGCHYALNFNFLLWDPHGLCFSCDRILWDLHFFAFFNSIFHLWSMSFRVDIGIFRMWIVSSMHFAVDIHTLMISFRRTIKSFVR